MGNEFAGKIAVVTGSSGIGFGAAMKFARVGATAYVCGIDEDHNAKAVASSVGLNLSVDKVDISDETAVSHWINKIGNTEGGIDILVNAAAIQSYGDIETTRAIRKIRWPK